MSPKLTVKPTVAQARFIRALYLEGGENGLYANPFRKGGCWWHPSYTDLYRIESQYGKPRASTIRKCIEEGWCEEFQENQFHVVLSSLGEEIGAQLTAEDLRDTQPGKVTARNIIDVLRKAHPKPDWIFANEVRLGTGYSRKRYYIEGMAKGISQEQRIDVFAMHTWPSKKFKRIVYEVKISRGDFMNELKDPHKRMASELFANECYFAAPAGMIKPEELPDGWGLFEVDGDLKATPVKAEYREAADMELPFIASLCRAIMMKG